jgi:phosphoglycerol transferase
VPEVRRTRRTGRLALDAALVALAALGILAVVYRLWAADLGVPFEYLPGDRAPYAFGPDAPFYLMIVKGAIDHGWFLDNPSLGYPFGQALHEFPQSLDNLNLLVLQVIGWVTGDAFVTVNVFFLLTFAGVSVSAFLVGIRLGLSRLAAATVALLFTFLPYHFARGTPHLLLSAYWLVPVAAYLLVRVVSPQPPFTVDADTPRGWRVSLRSRSAVLWLLACAGLASTGSYYAAITLTLVVLVTLVDLVARRDLRVAASAGVAVGAIAVVIIVNLLPTFVYWADNGRNPDLVQRGPSETEVNGLKISQLVLPVEGHRIDAFADIQADSTRFSVIDGERGQALGLLAAAGLVAVVGAALVAVRRRPAGDRPDTDPVERRAGAVLRVFGIATLAGILVAAVSGLSLVISGIGIKEIRSWNRISVFLGFFGLVAVGFGIDWVRRRLPDRPWRTPVTVAALALVVGVGVLDQFSPLATPEYEETAARFDSDRRFFGRVERTLPASAAVFNLPYVYFPEAGVRDRVGPYDSARGYLQTDELRWSWGGVVGTEADWVASAVRQPTDEMLDRLVAVGFTGLVFDRRSDAGGGLRGPALDLELGGPDFESPDGTLAFYDLRPWARDARDRLGADGLAEQRRQALRARVADPRA